MNEQLQDYLTQFQAIKRDAQDVVQSLDQQSFNQRLEPDAWSVAECFDHLNVIGAKLLPVIEEAMHSAKAKGLMRQGPFKYGLLGKWFIRAMEPPVKRKMRTPQLYTPSSDRLLDNTISEFMTQQDSFMNCIRVADGLDLARIKISSPVSKLIKFNLATWFAATAAHERRHLWQARQIKDKFPASSQ